MAVVHVMWSCHTSKYWILVREGGGGGSKTVKWKAYGNYSVIHSFIQLMWTKYPVFNFNTNCTLPYALWNDNANGWRIKQLCVKCRPKWCEYCAIQLCAKVFRKLFRAQMWMQYLFSLTQPFAAWFFSQLVPIIQVYERLQLWTNFQMWGQRLLHY